MEGISYSTTPVAMTDPGQPTPSKKVIKHKVISFKEQNNIVFYSGQELPQENLVACVWSCQSKHYPYDVA
jgi:hypothetical protein